MTITVNGKNYKINKSKELTVLQACELINIHIPRFCYHDKLSIAGNCRMCFVELPKAKKPALACSTAIHDGIELYTNTFVVKKAQESVLEFLLINHPLDCPICDQAGECDLQELTKNFGSDRGRFSEVKRSVEDLELGTVVKTIMTRCIHCTRCIRYASEILNIPSIGTSGRGRDTEISMYVDKILHSELSGNIVDLCPVGALTSKPYAFKARPWELNHIESIDILDSLGSSIRIDTKGNKVLRILPRINDYLNEEWITDKIRYSYDGLSLQRLTSPALSITATNSYLYTSWNYILNYIGTYFTYFRSTRDIQFYTGNLTDYRSSSITKFIASSLDSNKVNSSDYNLCIRSNYQVSSSLASLEAKELLYIVGCNLDYESPLIKLRVQKKMKNKIIYIIGSYWNSMIPTSIHKGTSIRSITKLLEGRTSTCYDFYKKNKIELLYRYNTVLNGRVAYSKLLSIVLDNILFLKKKYLHSYLGSINISHLSSHLGALQSSEVGLTTSYQGFNEFIKSSINNKVNIHINTHGDYLTNDFTALDKQQNVVDIYLGHHKPETSIKYDILLPTTSYLESNYYFLNNLGMSVQTNKALGNMGNSKSLYSVLLQIFNKISPLSYIRNSKKISNKIKFYSFSKNNIGIIFNNKSGMRIQEVIPSRIMHYFHCSDLMSFNSPIMVQLIKEKKKIESTFYTNSTYIL